MEPSASGITQHAQHDTELQTHPSSPDRTSLHRVPTEPSDLCPNIQHINISTSSEDHTTVHQSPSLSSILQPLYELDPYQIFNPAVTPTFSPESTSLIHQAGMHPNITLRPPRQSNIPNNPTYQTHSTPTQNTSQVPTQINIPTTPPSTISFPESIPSSYSNRPWIGSEIPSISTHPSYHHHSQHNGYSPEVQYPTSEPIPTRLPHPSRTTPYYTPPHHPYQ